MKHLLLILSIISFFLGYTQDSLNIRVLHHWYVDTIPNSNHPGYNGDIDNKYNEVWGYTSKGREYGFIGSTLGTHIFDVSDGSNVEEIIFIPGRVSDSLIVHRDFHDYEDYLYKIGRAHV